MSSFYSLYHKLVRAAVANELDQEIKKSRAMPDFDSHHLECILKPHKQAPVMRVGDCGCSLEDQEKCKGTCIFGAISSKDGNVSISPEKCTGCSACLDHCKSKTLMERKDLVPLLELLNQKETPVYAMIAPAFISQFSEGVTPGKLRSAFKSLGFSGMLEVALFADILTLKEALEFDRTIQDDNDFLLTSCCCPIWIAMIRKIYHVLVPHLPASVSPMVACGRSIKQLYPNAKTVFIGPCVAKKAEAKEADVSDAVDFVLTFQEIQEVFEAAEIQLDTMEEDLRDHSSKAGRIYARTGGVSEAVQSTLDRLAPNRKIPLRAKQANGALQCKQLLNEILDGKIDTNFIEGMGCVGGCVGGPKALIPKEEGTLFVNTYGEEALYKTPADNPYVIELLGKLGFETIESLLEHDNIFTRNFVKGEKK